MEHIRRDSTVQDDIRPSQWDMRLPPFYHNFITDRIHHRLDGSIYHVVDSAVVGGCHLCGTCTQRTVQIILIRPARAG